MHITSIGIDLGKTTFHLVTLGEQSKVLARKKFSRKQLLAYTANLPGFGVGSGTVTAENPTADLETPDNRPTQRGPAQLCIGSAAVLGNSRVASRRPREIESRSSSIIRMSRTTPVSALRHQSGRENCNG